MEQRKLEVGSHVIYTDQIAQRHEAIITAVWGSYATTTGPEPGCNLVYVSADGAKTDRYGRQIERETSVVHRSNQAAGGRFWSWPDEQS